MAIFDIFETVGSTSIKFAHNFEHTYFADRQELQAEVV